MIRNEVSEENGGMHYTRKEFFSSYCKPMKDPQLVVMRGNVVNNLPIAISIIIVYRVLCPPPEFLYVVDIH